MVNDIEKSSLNIDNFDEVSDQESECEGNDTIMYKSIRWGDNFERIKAISINFKNDKIPSK